MNERALLQRRAALVAEQGAILASPDGEGGGLSPDQATASDALQAQIDALAADIARVRAHTANELGLEATQTVEGDDTTEALEGAGGGTQHRTPEEGGDQGFEHLGTFLQAVYSSLDPRTTLDPRLVPSAAATGMGAVVPQDGGFLIQSQFSDALLGRARDVSEVWSRASNTPIGTGADRLIEPYIDETSRVDGSRYGGVSVQWRSEAQTATASRPKIAENELKLEELVGIGYATNRSLQNAQALASLMDEAFRDEFAVVLDDSAYRANGDGKPLGILNSPVLISVAKEVGQEVATIYFENISKMWARMPMKLRKEAVWFINQDIEPQLDQMTIDVGGGGMPAYMPPGGLNDAPYGRLKGRLVVPIEQASTIGTKGDIMLAAMSRYRTIDQGGIEAATSMHVKFEEREQAFRFVLMANGQPKDRSAITPMQGSSTVGPFITLDERA